MSQCVKCGDRANVIAKTCNHACYCESCTKELTITSSMKPYYFLIYSYDDNGSTVVNKFQDPFFKLITDGSNLTSERCPICHSAVKYFMIDKRQPGMRVVIRSVNQQ